MGDSLQYQVYEVTYERSFSDRKKILQSGLSRREARELAKWQRDSQDPTNIISKGYGFEAMDPVI